MAKRLQNLRSLREQAEQASKMEAEARLAEHADTPAKTKPTAAPKRKPRAKKAPPRFYARWCIFSNAGKPIELFDYRDEIAANEKLATLLTDNKGSHYLQLVKEQIAEIDA